MGLESSCLVARKYPHGFLPPHLPPTFSHFPALPCPVDGTGPASGCIYSRAESRLSSGRWALWVWWGMDLRAAIWKCPSARH